MLWFIFQHTAPLGLRDLLCMCPGYRYFAPLGLNTFIFLIPNSRYLEVNAHLEQHPDEDYVLLFMGKFGLQHLPLVKSLLEQEMISLPKFLPEMLLDKKVNL